MVKIKELTDEQVQEAIDDKEFSESVRIASEYVAVILTQDWCSQWMTMSGWLKEIESKGDAVKENISVFTLQYNQKPYFQKFMNFKETTWKNDRIPYVRYYKNGKFISNSNYVSKDQFFRSFV
jgi:hypothetical protein